MAGLLTAPFHAAKNPSLLITLRHLQRNRPVNTVVTFTDTTGMDLMLDYSDITKSPSHLTQL